MRSTQANRVAPWRRSFAAFLVGMLLFGGVFAQTAAVALKSTLASDERALAANITIQAIKDATATLSSPEMEGRGTMQPGGEKAAAWIAERFKALGMKPLGDKASFLQKVDFRETVYTPETSFKVGDESFRFGKDFAFQSLPFKRTDKEKSGEMIFIAYGIQAASIKRDDLEGIDVRGKVVVMIEGPPASINKDSWDKAEASSAIFLNLVRAGVAGIVYIAHGREKEAPETMIDYYGRRSLSLAGGTEDSEPFPLPLLVSVGTPMAEKLFAKSGISLKDALARAEENTFKPVKLNQTAKIVARSKSTKGTSPNVVGYIEGSDPKLKEEAILFSAHYDAFGTENGKVYPGAADNGLGTAEMLAVAEAFSKSPVKPKRSLIFLAVTAEEYGLFGSKYWAKNPTWNIKKVSANLNLDGVGTEVYGPVKTMVGYGAEHSTLGAMLTDVSAAMGIVVAPDPVPDEKVFYRSDHYSFVERGVPALMLMGAPEGDIQNAMKRMREWEKTDYHQPGDVIRPDWSWDGAKTVAEVMGIMGLRLANADSMPEWLSTSRFAKLERGNTKELPEEK
ncbi:MAG: M20/M25/M40 family metallo-hydrolase [Acidobacteria bacterium]|nr:M20/M25/M40 family metallo-hydrolase [Acidobacteriota bacterium]